MNLPSNNIRLVVILLIISFLIIISGVYFVYFLLNKTEEPKTNTVEEIVQPKEIPKIPAKVLAAEKLPQFPEETNEYNLNDIEGTPNKSMFPDVQNPKFLQVIEEKKLEGSSIVASFHVDSDYRAYPLKYINFHHIVNDKFGKKPVLISYCGICNSAAAYDPVLGGQTLSFGVLGVLLHNDLVMYDRNTDSWWIQITGEAISGKLKGKRLTLLPGMELVKFSDFKKAHPKGRILQPIPKYEGFYDQFDPAQFYDGGPEEGGSYALNRNQVVGIEVRGMAKAYKKDDVRNKKIINDKLNGWSLLIVADPIDGGVRVLRRFLEDEEVILEFELKNGILVDKETGSTWNFLGEAIDGKLKGKILAQPEYLELFQFAWEGFYPKTSIYRT